MTAYEKMHSGNLYISDDDELINYQVECLNNMYDFNNLRPSEFEAKDKLIKQMFAEAGDNCYIEAPFHANWGGKHVHLGKNVYINYNATFVDDTHIYIGDYTKLGPNVTLATAGHPILPELRMKTSQYNLPIRIGCNCWLGAGVIVLPGITIGDNSVIGAGSVVTKDIPANVVAVGSPCKVLRPIGEYDEKYYYKNKKINI